MGYKKRRKDVIVLVILMALLLLILALSGFFYFTILTGNAISTGHVVLVDDSKPSPSPDEPEEADILPPIPQLFRPLHKSLYTTF